MDSLAVLQWAGAAWSSFFLVFWCVGSVLIAYASAGGAACVDCRRHHFGQRRQEDDDRDRDSDSSLNSSNSNDDSLSVSLLRPLKDIDANLEENLASGFRLVPRRGGRVQQLLSVAHRSDPALALANRLIHSHPHADAALVVGEQAVGANPKVNNLVRSYRNAKYDLLWICDSNIALHPHALRTALAFFARSPDVGIVHHAPRGIDALSLGARLEQMFLNTAHLRIYLVINFWRFDSCIMGKSTLFRRSDLDRCHVDPLTHAISILPTHSSSSKNTGLPAFGAFMAEDHRIGQAIWKMNKRHVLSPLPATQKLGVMSLRDYFLRRSRWTRIRAYTLPLVTLIEPFSECLVLSLIFGHSLSSILSSYSSFTISAISPWLLSYLYAQCWFILDVFLFRALAPEDSTPWFQYTLAWLLRELTAVPLFLVAVCASNTVVWRGKVYRLKLGGTVEPVQDDKQS